MIPSLSAPVAAAVNHLLADESWARERLAAHAGKTAAIDFAFADVRLSVERDGMIAAAAAEAVPAVVIRIKPADLPLILQNRDRAFSYVKIEGDADFANAISQLSQSLRWDVEEDLSRVVGDIAARRFTAAGRQAWTGAMSLQRQFAESMAEYLLEEKAVLIRPEAVSDFAADVARLRDDVERLAKRIEKLTKK